MPTEIEIAGDVPRICRKKLYILCA